MPSTAAPTTNVAQHDTPMSSVDDIHLLLIFSFFTKDSFIHITT